MDIFSSKLFSPGFVVDMIRSESPEQLASMFNDFVYRHFEKHGKRVYSDNEGISYYVPASAFSSQNATHTALIIEIEPIAKCKKTRALEIAAEALENLKSEYHEDHCAKMTAIEPSKHPCSCHKKDIDIALASINEILANPEDNK